ncbi:CHAT domain-containing tetratricopeptide repeat protein [Actinosynnema sp. CS-041913]|uniref:CHAT domain-containing tetratricopeptide repeat protein n=1 Tax=Actinosynnema sp. CS-041913 TaxID=3239917 RepID=UPI003D92B27C
MSELTITSRGRDEVLLTAPTGAATVPFRNPCTPELAETLRWLLEDCPRLAIGPDHRRRTAALSTVDDIGAALFQVLSASPESAALVRPVVEAPGDHAVRIVSDDASFLGLPWELLHRPGAADKSLASARELVRRRVTPRRSRPSAERSPATRPLRVLLVSPRPFGAMDVRPRTVRGPLLRAAELTGGAVAVDLLRPATVEQLRTVLADRDGYDILHFDGHGYAEAAAGGVDCGLVFEDEEDRGRRVSAAEFADLVPTDRIPLIVLNACRSAYHHVPAADSPVVGEANSVASALLDRGARAVLAMTHTVEAGVVATFMTAFYDALTHGRALAAAVADGRRALLPEATGEDRSARPFHIIPVLYEQQPVDLRVQVGTPGGHTAGPDAPEAASVQSLMYQDGELADIDRQLHRGNPVVVHAPVASGKSVLLRAYARYALLSNGFEHVEFITGEQLAADEGLLPRRIRDNARRFAGRPVLHVWDGVDGHVDLCAEAVRALPAEHRVLMSARHDSFTLPHHSHATGDLPDDLVAHALVDPMKESMAGDSVLPLNEPEFKWLIRCTGWHGGTLAAVLRAWGSVPLSRIPWRLDLGYPEGDGDPFLDAAVRRRLAELPPPMLSALSYLGLFGYLIVPTVLSVFTDRGLVNDRFHAVTGTHISSDDWRELLDQAHRAGVLRPTAHGVGREYHMSPVVGYALRGELAGRFSPEQLRALQRGANASVVGVIKNMFPGQPKGVGYAGRQARELMSAYMDSNVWIAMLRAIEAADYGLAGELAAAYHDDEPLGSLAWWRSIEVVTHVFGLCFDRLKSDPDARGLRLSLHEMIGQAAMARSDWEQATLHVEHILADRDHPLVRPNVLSMLLWRNRIALEMGHPNTVRATLAEAVRHASAEADGGGLDRCRAMVRRAVRDFELPPLSAAELAREVGLADMADELRAAETEDTAARPVETLLSELREAMLDSRLSTAAELQRTLGVTARERRDFAAARHWLTSAIELELGTPGVGNAARTALHLAILEEETNNLDDAASWCHFVLDLPSANGLRKANAHYELGIVELKRGRDDDALRELAAARSFYSEHGMALYVADADSLIAQALRRKGDVAGAIELGEAVVRTMMGFNSDERTAVALMSLAESLVESGDAQGAQEQFARFLLSSDQLTPQLITKLTARFEELLSEPAEPN